MMNGDISNRTTDIIVFLDGINFLYQPIGGWWKKLLRKMACRRGNVQFMLHLIKIYPNALKAIRSLANNRVCYLRMMAFNAQESFVLNECILADQAHLGLVVEVDTDNQFRDYAAMADLMVSNRRVHGVGPKRIMYKNPDEAVSQLGGHFKFGSPQ